MPKWRAERYRPLPVAGRGWPRRYLTAMGRAGADRMAIAEGRASRRLTSRARCLGARSAAAPRRGARHVHLVAARGSGLLGSWSTADSQPRPPGRHVGHPWPPRWHAAVGLLPRWRGPPRAPSRLSPGPALDSRLPPVDQIPALVSPPPPPPQ